jgi:hypothetical protein
MDRTMTKHLKTEISRIGQPYVDDPVFEVVSKANTLALSIGAGLQANFKTPGVPMQPSIEQQTGHERVRLRWMKPDGQGGLVPRGSKS